MFFIINYFVNCSFFSGGVFFINLERFFYLFLVCLFFFKSEMRAVFSGTFAASIHNPASHVIFFLYEVNLVDRGINFQMLNSACAPRNTPINLEFLFIYYGI